MKKNMFKIRKPGVFTVVTIFIIVALVPISNSESISNDNPKPFDIFKNNPGRSQIMLEK